jgi:hypothetical protein
MMETLDIRPGNPGAGYARAVDATLSSRGHRVRMLSPANIPRFAPGELRLSSLLAYWPPIARELRNFDVVNVRGPAPTMSDAFLRLPTLLPHHSRPAIVYTYHSPIDIRGARRASARYSRLHDSLALMAAGGVPVASDLPGVRDVAGTDGLAGAARTSRRPVRCAVRPMARPGPAREAPGRLVAGRTVAQLGALRRLVRRRPGERRVQALRPAARLRDAARSRRAGPRLMDLDMTRPQQAVSERKAPRLASIRREWPLATFCCCVAGIALLCNLFGSPDILYDEAAYTWAAQQVAQGWHLTLDNQAFFVHPPLMFLLQAGWLRLTGQGSAALPSAIRTARLLAGFAGVVDVLLVASLACRLAAHAEPRRRRLLTGAVALVTALDPVLVRYDRQDVIEPFALCASLLVLHAAWALRSRGAVAYVAVTSLLTGLALLTNQITIFVIVVPLVFALLQRDRLLIRWSAAALGIGAGLLAGVPAVRHGSALGGQPVAAGLDIGGAPEDYQLLALAASYHVDAVVSLGGSSVAEQATTVSLRLGYLLLNVPPGTAPTWTQLRTLDGFMRAHDRGGDSVYVHTTSEAAGPWPPRACCCWSAATRGLPCGTT